MLKNIGLIVLYRLRCLRSMSNYKTKHFWKYAGKVLFTILPPEIPNKYQPIEFIL